MSQSQHAESIGTAVLKLTPPAGVVTAAAAGMTLQDWVWAATLVYTSLMTAKLVWDWLIKPFLAKRKGP